MKLCITYLKTYCKTYFVKINHEKEDSGKSSINSENNSSCDESEKTSTKVNDITMYHFLAHIFLGYHQKLYSTENMTFNETKFLHKFDQELLKREMH